MRTCLYVGSFDPFHNGHLNMVKKLCNDYDKVYVMIVKNYLKKPRLFHSSDMREAINSVFERENLNAECLNVSRYISSSYIAKMLGCECICRGLYKEEDKKFENLVKKYHEFTGVDVNIYPNEISISGTQIRKEFLLGKDVASFVPKEILEVIEKSNDEKRVIAKKQKMQREQELIK